MKIIDILTHVEVLKLKDSQTMGHGHLENETDNLFICIVTDNGIKGYGEAATWNVSKSHTAKELEDIVHEMVLPVLYKQEVENNQILMDNINSNIKGCENLKCAIEIALLDVLGKYVRVPMYKLIGKPASNYIQLSYSVSKQNVEQEIEKIGQCIETGYRIYKIKVGCLSFDEDRERLIKIRNMFPNTELRVDFNQNINSIKDLSRYLDVFGKVGINYIEQPFNRKNDLWMKDFKNPVYNFVGDESCIYEQDIKHICANMSFNTVSLKIQKVGGLKVAKKIYEYASKFGIKGYAGATSETTLTVRAAANLFSTFNNMVNGSDCYFPFEILRDEFMYPVLKPIDGKVYLSEDYGVGCEPPKEWFL